MKNSLVKLFALILPAYFVLLSLVGCNKENSAKAEENTEAAANGTTVREIDMEGYTFKIAQWWDGSPNEEGEIARHKAVEEKYNCKIEYVIIPFHQIVSKFTSSVLSEEPVADIILFEAISAIPVFAASGFIIPVDEYFDFSDPKWPPIIKQTGRYKGRQYGFTNYSWDVAGIYYNKGIIRNEGLPDPFTLQEEGKWTWEKFAEIAQKVTKDIDGDGINDQWGLTIQDHNLFSPLILSNDANIIEIDETGKATLTLDDPKAIEALQFFSDLYNKYKVVMPTIDADDWQEAPRNFSKGNVAFFFGQGWDGQDFRKAMDRDYGLVFMPKGPKALDYIVPVQNEAKIYVMPKHSKYPKEAAMIFEELFSFNDTEAFRSYVDSFLYSEVDLVTAYKMRGKVKVTMFHAYPGFCDMLYSKLVDEVVTNNVPAETFVRSFKDEAQESIDNEY
jgi:ABC-type glycerol-3-phosphate transport system substrate-binding protein